MQTAKKIFIYTVLLTSICLDIVFGQGFPIYTFLFCAAALLYLYIKPYVI